MQHHQTRAVPASSTIANLETRATTESATVAVSKSIRTGASVNFSGQYLYDRFITNPGKEELTKMDIVRGMVDALDVGTFKANIAEMVSIAKEKNKESETPETLAKLKTAQNHQSVMRIAYGAIRFASDKLEEMGYDPKATGYQLMRVIGTKALEAKSLKWDGSPLKSKADRDAARNTKAEAKAIAQAMDETPKLADESRAAYLERIDARVAVLMAQQAAETESERIADLVKLVKEKAGELLPDLLKVLSV